jgi:hypothetical protein
MPRKSRRRNRRNRRVSSTKRIRGTRRFSRVRRFRVSRGGNIFGNVINKAQDLLGKDDQTTGVSGNGLTDQAKGLVGSARGLLNGVRTAAFNRASQAYKIVSDAVPSARH